MDKSFIPMSLKKIAVASLISAGLFSSTNIYAEVISIPIEIGDEAIIRLESESVDIVMDVGYQFEEITRVCLKGSVKEGNAQQFGYHVQQEYNPPYLPIGIGAMIPLLYEASNPNLPSPSEIEMCDTFIFPGIFLDSDGEFKIEVADGYLEFWDLRLEIEGTISDMQVALTLDESDDFTVPFYGGRVKYDASIQNLNSSSASRNVKQWSVIKLPNGDSFPVHKLREFDIDYLESKDFTRTYVNIPGWFEPGDYKLIWHVVDPETGVFVRDSIEFSKE